MRDPFSIVGVLALYIKELQSKEIVLFNLNSCSSKGTLSLLMYSRDARRRRTGALLCTLSDVDDKR